MMDQPRRTRPQWIRHATSFFQKKRQTPSLATHWIQVYPPNPSDLLSGRLEYEGQLLRRRMSLNQDCKMEALYRIYEHIMLGQHEAIRGEFQRFWYHFDWKIRDIPDPRDPDPERYAVVACIPALMCVTFNERLRLGFPRKTPDAFSRNTLDQWRMAPPEWETEPEWTEWVPQLSERLVIPYWDKDTEKFVKLDSYEAEKVSKEFEAKNVLMCQPHIYFT